MKGKKGGMKVTAKKSYGKKGGKKSMTLKVSKGQNNYAWGE